jgi:AraC-like DNA-binding protein
MFFFMTKFFKYLNIGELEEKWGLYVTTVGCSLINPRQAYPNNAEHPQDHSFSWNKGRILDAYYLIFISKGNGIFESAKTEQKMITAGTCFFLYPGIWHRYKPNPNSGWEEYWIGFKGSYADELMSKGFFDPANPFINVGFHAGLLTLLQRLLETVNASSAGYHQMMAGITLQILGLVNAVSKEQEDDLNPTAKLISKAKYLMQESLEKPVEMDKLVRELPMGYSKFRKAFKQSTGESPNQYHLNLRLNRAKDLLTSTALNINEVAYQTGFDSVFYFSKLFKKKNGICPKHYRNESMERV